MLTKTNFKGKILVLLLTLTIAIGITPSYCFGDSADVSPNITIAHINAPSDLEKTEDTDIAEIPKDIVLKSSAEDLKETLDNGTVLVVDDATSISDIKSIGNLLDENYLPDKRQPLQAMQGIYLTSDEQGGYNISELIAEIVPPCKENSDKSVDVSTKELQSTLDHIIKNDKIDMTEIYYDVETRKTDIAKFKNLSKTHMAQLQAGSITGNSFMDKTSNFNLYGFTGTKVVAGYTKKDANWVKASTTKVTGYLAKVKTTGNTTYDAFQGVVTVSPTTKFKVSQYNTKLATPQNTRYTTLEESFLKSGSKTFTVKLDLSASQGGAGASVGYTYTFNPDGQNITNHIGNKYTQWWQAYPASPKKGASYRIQPSMIIKAANGKTTTATAYVTLSYQKLTGLAGTYKSDTDKTITLNFKNHKRV